MSIENFSTGWTETDPSGKLSQTATRSSFTNLIYNEGAVLNKNSTVSLGDGFVVAFDFYINSSSGTLNYGIPLLDLGDSTQTYYFSCIAGEASSNKVYIELSAIELNTFTFDQVADSTTLSVDTVYYAKIVRNDGASTNGTYYLYVYGSDANRIADVSRLLTITMPLTVFSGGKTYIYADTASVYDDGGTIGTTGYVENLDLTYVPTKSVSASAQKVTSSLGSAQKKMYKFPSANQITSRQTTYNPFVKYSTPANKITSTLNSPVPSIALQLSALTIRELVNSITVSTGSSINFSVPASVIRSIVNPVTIGITGDANVAVSALVISSLLNAPIPAATKILESNNITMNLTDPIKGLILNQGAFVINSQVNAVDKEISFAAQSLEIDSIVNDILIVFAQSVTVDVEALTIALSVCAPFIEVLQRAKRISLKHNDHTQTVKSNQGIRIKRFDNSVLTTKNNRDLTSAKIGDLE